MRLVGNEFSLGSSQSRACPPWSESRLAGHYYNEQLLDLLAWILLPRAVEGK